jgi:CheY-like chemotaxis protein
MSQGQPLPASTILLIEADYSLRRLITLGLHHRGMHVIQASTIQELPSLDAQTLDLLIVDVDRGVKSDWSLLSALHEQVYIPPLPIVALSWESPAESKTSFPVSICSKPFDARTLHRTIATLLAERAHQKAAQVALVEAQILAGYEQHAAPSIWPVLTAAGLLVTVMGLLVHVLVALVGVMLVLTVLLLWMLGTKPAFSARSSTIVLKS